jgi:hypothetical protein
VTLPKPGDRIELIEMGPEDDGRPDPDPILPGAQGIVEEVQKDIHDHPSRAPWHQVHVRWDSGRTLSLSLPKDRFKIIPPAKAGCQHGATYIRSTQDEADFYAKNCEVVGGCTDMSDGPLWARILIAASDLHRAVVAESTQSDDKGTRLRLRECLTSNGVEA